MNNSEKYFQVKVSLRKEEDLFHFFLTSVAVRMLSYLKTTMSRDHGATPLLLLFPSGTYYRL